MTRFALIALLCLLSAPAVAQVVGTVLPGDPPGGPVELPVLLPKVAWDPARRGVLLVVAPERARSGNVPVEAPSDWPPNWPKPFRSIGMDDLGPPAADGYSLRALEKVLDRRATPFGTVTVFAPQWMEVLNSGRLPAPDGTGGLSPDTALRLWEASLNDSQWNRYASPEGIGVGDLDREQATLFLATIPSDVSVNAVARSGGRLKMSLSPSLPPSQRSQIRRTISRRMSWSYPVRNGGRMSIGEGVVESALVAPPTTLDPSRRSDAVFFGQTMRTSVPNRPKPGHIDFANAALSVPVDLAGAKTVGDLVKRCADTVRVPIHCDPRYAGLTVFVRGDSARAGDLLKAVALGVTGTFRKVGADYVLTDDLAPLGFRMAHAVGWIEANAAKNAQRKIDAELRRKNLPYERAAWPDPERRPSPALEARIRNGEGRSFSEQTPVPIAELPPAVRAEVEAQIQRRPGDFERALPGVVLPRVDLVRAFFLPGVGPLADQTSRAVAIGRGDQVLPTLDVTPAPAPGTLPRSPRAGAMVDADTPESAAALVELAARAGFDSLWIASPGERPDVFRAAVAAARPHRLEIHAVVRIGRGPTGHPDTDPTVDGGPASSWARRTVRLPWRVFATEVEAAYRESLADNVLRQGEALRIDRPVDLDRMRRRLRDAAALPGLAGVAVVDWMLPGYDDHQRATGLWSDVDTGYTTEARLAHLRATGIDPTDVPPRPFRPYHYGYDPMDTFRARELDLEHFPSRTEELGTAWRARRATVARAVLAALREIRLPVPCVFVQEPTFGPYFASLDLGPPPTPIAVGEATAEGRRARIAKTSRVVVEHVPWWSQVPPETPVDERVARWVAAVRAYPRPTSDPRVYDLTSLPPTEQRAALSALRVEARP